MMLDWIANRVGEQLKSQRLVLATAESCTGGWVAQAVTSVAGSSDWFDRGFVTYSNAAKREMLGVRDETLARHGAVSEETAREMAAGALAASRAHVALAITGIAGPAGGTRRSRSARCASRGRGAAARPRRRRAISRATARRCAASRSCSACRACSTAPPADRA